MNKQSRITGAIALSTAQAIVLVLGYLTHLWIGRVLGPAPYGIYGVIVSIQTIVGIFLALGVPIAVSRFIAQDEEHAQTIVRQALRIQAAIAFMIAIALLLTSPLIARVLKDTTLTRYIAFVAAVLFFQAFYPVFAQFLSGMHYFNRQAALTSFYAITKLAGAIGLMYLFEVYGALFGFAVGGISAAMLGWVWTRKLGGEKPRPLPMKSFLSFAGTYVLVLAGLQLLISLDLFMVKAILRDDIVAGYYNAAVTLSRIPYLLLQGLAFILLPSVSRLTKPDLSHDEAAIFIRDVLRYLIALIVPSAALAAATSKGLIMLFFSSEYIPAAPALTILMVGLGCLGFYLLLINIVAGAGRAPVGLAITIALLIISAFTGALLIPQYGMQGAALQTTIAGVVGLAILSAYTFKTFHIPVPTRSILNILVATAIATAPTYIWKATSVMLLIQYMLLGTLYVTLLIVLGEVRSKDWQRIAELHPTLRRLAPKEN